MCRSVPWCVLPSSGRCFILRRGQKYVDMRGLCFKTFNSDQNAEYFETRRCDPDPAKTGDGFKTETVSCTCTFLLLFLDALNSSDFYLHTCFQSCFSCSPFFSVCLFDHLSVTSPVLNYRHSNLCFIRSAGSRAP